MKKLLFLFSTICFLFSSVLVAQENCKLRGEVRDSLNLPVFDASVSVFNSKNEGAGFAFTDTEGFFSIELPCNENYEVEIEHYDYESFEQSVKLDKSKTLKFNLKESRTTLEQVVINAKKPITVKGDTIEYDADSFRTAADENLEDLLKKLPGLEVENGKVYYEGKEIKTIKVGNREVLGGNTKLLTKNLPADAIDKVQLNKKFKANPFSNSLSDDEEAMLNIELKEDKKSLIFGNVTVGGDADKHYDLQSKLFYFSPKTDATSITDYNTYGKEVFTYEDYFTFLGGFSEFTEEGSSFSMREEANRISLGTAQNAAEMDALLTALHFGYEPNKKWFTNGFVLFNYNDLSFKSSQERIGENLHFKDENQNDQRLFSALGRIRLDYTPNNRAQWKYSSTFNFIENEDKQFANTFLNELPTGTRNNSNQNNSFSFRHNLSYIRKVGRNDNLGIYIRHQINNQRPDLLITTDMMPLIIDDLSFYDLKQNRRFKGQNLQIYGIYNHLVTNTSNLRFKIGSNFSWQSLTNKIYETDSWIQQPNFRTDADFDFTELYADLTYTRKIGFLKFDLGIGVHNFRENTQTLTDSRTLNLTKFLPHF
ncbi:MAG: carboxypeptidase-like regulatory domain-containing protein, partial [Weeksellaceae bacterium]|nr:carboxypeptidase-like regulatory domain-containing protein [Weeksellaceae bacterium]